MDDLELGEIGRICSKRHDIVHRNGKTRDDQPIELTLQEVQRAIGAIRNFAEDLNTRINAALSEQESDEF